MPRELNRTCCVVFGLHTHTYHRKHTTLYSLYSCPSTDLRIKNKFEMRNIFLSKKNNWKLFYLATYYVYVKNVSVYLTIII